MTRDGDQGTWSSKGYELMDLSQEPLRTRAEANLAWQGRVERSGEFSPKGRAMA